MTRLQSIALLLLVACPASIPTDCPKGQALVSNGKGGWTCEAVLIETPDASIQPTSDAGPTDSGQHVDAGEGVDAGMQADASAQSAPDASDAHVDAGPTPFDDAGEPSTDAGQGQPCNVGGANYGSSSACAEECGVVSECPWGMTPACDGAACQCWGDLQGGVCEGVDGGPLGVWACGSGVTLVDGEQTQTCEKTSAYVISCQPGCELIDGIDECEGTNDRGISRFCDAGAGADCWPTSAEGASWQCDAGVGQPPVGASPGCCFVQPWDAGFCVNTGGIDLADASDCAEEEAFYEMSEGFPGSCDGGCYYPPE